VLAAPEDPAHAIDVKAQHVEVILKLARRQYDVVVIDLGRSLDAVSVQALDVADMVFPVLELNLPAIHDAKRLLGVLRSLGYAQSKIKPVLNRHDRGSELTLADVEKTLGARIFRRFPSSVRAVQSVNQGVPIAKLARNDPMSRSLVSFADALVPQPRAEVGWLSRMLGRP
jgi:pilus assembly protein CpaE